MHVTQSPLTLPAKPTPNFHNPPSTKPSNTLPNTTETKMFIQYYHQTQRCILESILPEIPQNKYRLLNRPAITWPTLASKQIEDMGCGPSRPSRSFYSEYFVEPPHQKAPSSKTQSTNQRPGVKHNISPPRPQVPARLYNAPGDGPVIGAEENLEEGEESARGDLRIYQEEMEARRMEEKERTFVINAVVRGEEVVF